MLNTLKNTLADMLAGIWVVIYRTFVEFRWRPPQPMFNILEVREGYEALFEEFLVKAQHLSAKYNTPIGLGPFKTGSSRTYIYVTHYGSTGDFLLVMGGLTFTGLSLKRAKATRKAMWTYCELSTAPALDGLQNMLMVGIEGDENPFLQYLQEHKIEIAAVVKRKLNVRRGALDTYFVMPNTPENVSRVEKFKPGESLMTFYPAKANSQI
jgi:hypothetical protein